MNEKETDGKFRISVCVFASLCFLLFLQVMRPFCPFDSMQKSQDLRRTRMLVSLSVNFYVCYLSQNSLVFPFTTTMFESLAAF